MDYSEMKIYTLNHFTKLARDNRFPENAKISHDNRLCLICRPENIEEDVFEFLLDLVIQCIAQRRPSLDEDLLKAIQEETGINEANYKVNMESLARGDEEAYLAWRLWAWTAVNTAFDMLSVHGSEAPYVQLEDGLSNGKETCIESKLRELFEKQRGTSIRA